jgi:drug/metabolite transporter (DMT)-like permease
VTDTAEPAATASGAIPARKLWLGALSGALASTIWGVQAVVSRQSVADGLTAADVTVVRFLAAGLALLPFALAMRPFPVGALGWPRAIVLTWLAGAPYSLVLTGGAAFAPALHAGLVTPGLIPVVAAVLGFAVAGERPSLARILGLGLIVAGVSLFAFGAFDAVVAGGGAWRGDLLYVLAAFMWALFGLLAKRWGVEAFAVTVITCVLSALAIPLWAPLFTINLFNAALPAIALQALYQGLLVGIGAFFLYAQSVVLLGAARAALFLPLVPAVAAIAGLLLLGERPSPFEIAGMVVVMVGMGLALRAR